MLPQVKAQAAACGAPLLVQLADQIDLLEDVLQNIRTALVDDPPAEYEGRRRHPHGLQQRGR